MKMRNLPLAALRTAACAALAVGGLALAAPAQASPVGPGGIGHAAPGGLVTTVQWGGGHGWRHEGWGRPGWGHGYGHGYGRGFYGHPHRCRTTYVRRWSEWRGGWVVRPVERCW
jgi:hypothetical protein